MTIPIVLFIVWVIIFFLAVETKSGVCRALMPFIMAAGVAYIFTWTVVLFLNKEKKF